MMVSVLKPKFIFAMALPVVFLAALAASLVSCTKKSPQPADSAAAGPSQQQTQQDLIAKGRTVFMTNCTACHNTDPKKDGAVGPAIYGSSLELITKRVMEASYPPGYKPKRETHTMVALPHLKDDLPAIHAFLNAP